MPKVGDIVADKYEIIQLIGEGGMGSVFLASHNLTGKRVAIKWMLPDLAQDQDAVQRFLREAQAAGRIAHPNVVDIYDVGDHLGSYFLVMEYLHGETLTALMERGRLRPEQIVDILLPCLRGVAAAHNKGVIHRDLKPDNIFLCRSEDGGFLHPKVLDFGISKLSSTDSEVNPRLTRTGAVMGTPYYMSPEQIRGSRNVDGRCDVYAFGVILYEALAGQVPFSAETYSALVLEIATGTPVMLRQINPELPAALDAVVMQAMAREPADRYPTALALGEALAPFAGGARFTSVERLDPVRSRRHGSATSSQSSTPFATGNTVAYVPRRRSVTLWLSSILAGAAAVGLAAWWVGARDPEGSGVSEDVRAGDPRAGDPTGAAAHQPVVREPPGASADDQGLQVREPRLPVGDAPPTGMPADSAEVIGVAAEPDPAEDAPAAEAADPVDEPEVDPQPAVSATQVRAVQDDRRSERPSRARRRRARMQRAREASRRSPVPPAPTAEDPPVSERPSSGEASPPRGSRSTRRGRTGSLSVDDF